MDLHVHVHVHAIGRFGVKWPPQFLRLLSVLSAFLFDMAGSHTEREVRSTRPVKVRLIVLRACGVTPSDLRRPLSVRRVVLRQPRLHLGRPRRRSVFHCPRVPRAAPAAPRVLSADHGVLDVVW